MTHGIVVHHAAEGEKRHGAPQALQRIARLVEEEDIAQPQHHARHRQRQHGQQVQQLPQRGKLPPLLLGIGQQQNKPGPDQRRQGTKFEGVIKGQPTLDTVAIELVVLQRQSQIIGPEADKRAVDRHAYDGDDQQTAQQTP